jgi:site-specific recombinase XerD
MEPDDCEAAVDRRMENLKNIAISENNRKAVVDFCQFCYTDGLRAKRVLKYLYSLPLMAQWLGKDFQDADRADVEAVVNKIERSSYSEWSKHDFKVSLKKFFKWLRKLDDSYPPEVKWVSSTVRNTRIRLPEELLTQTEVEDIIKATMSDRDRALISLLYESGCRISELRGLRMKQVQKHQHGFQVTLFGKTGARRLLLIASSPYLTAWLNQHPKNSDPEAFVWVTNDCRAAKITYTRVCDIIRRAARRAGIKKAVNPHNFRHSRATHLAKHLTEAQMNEYMGWVQGSGMPSTYVHLSGHDIDNAMLKINNIAVAEEEKAENSFVLKICHQCKLQNAPANKFCSRCGTALDEKTALEHTESRQNLQATDLLKILTDDPDIKTIIAKKLQELNSNTI